jgi:TRAP-type uncharacterized transport system substrate-binding protein
MALELAAELVGDQEWPYPRAHVSLRARDFDDEGFVLFGSGSPDGIDMLARGEIQVGMINPSAVLTMAHRGTGPFAETVPVRVISVLPSFDQLVFSVTEQTGLQSLEEVAARRYPLRVSIRGPRENSVPLVVETVLAAHGFSLDDIVSWGGSVTYDRRLPGARMVEVEEGNAAAIFDEAVIQFVERAVELGMRHLDVDASVVAGLGATGLRPGTVAKADFPKLPADVHTVDFSGFPVYTHADVPDAQVTAVCRALEARADRIPWEGHGALPLARMCRDTEEGPLDVPLHPAAEAFWRERGYSPS